MSDYGFEIRRSDGSISLNMRETFARFVHRERVYGGASTTFSVPAFDAVEVDGVFTGKGFFYVQYVVQRRQNDPNRAQTVLGAMISPGLSWNNTTKVMTFTPASIPAEWPFRTVPDYDIIFIHFR